MKHAAAERHSEEAPQQPHRTYRPEELKSLADKMIEQQASEKYSESWDEFSHDLGVEVAMGKDRSKRPGGERGEDMFLVDKETGLVGVFDGLGGEGKVGSGANASGTAALFMPSLYRAMSRAVETPDVLKAGLDDVARDLSTFEHPNERAKAAIELRKTFESHDPSIQKEIVALSRTITLLSEKIAETGGMTTATVGKTVKLGDGRMFEVIASVGDSGAMRLSADGKAEDVTQEDSTVDQAISMGLLTREEAKSSGFTVKLPNGALVPVKKLRRGMYQAVGMKGQSLVPRISVVELKPGDRIAYATDGIRDVIAEEDGSFDAKAAARLLGGGNASAFLDQVAAADAARGKDKKGDEMTMLIKERYLAAEPDEDEIELDESDIV